MNKKTDTNKDLINNNLANNNLANNNIANNNLANDNLANDNLANHKLVDIDYVMNLLQDGDTIAFGGNALQRSPLFAARCIAQKGFKDISVVKTAIAYEADLLAAVGALQKLYAGFVGYETEFGLCNHVRKGVQSGTMQMEEHACYTVITALRASAYGVDFLPVKGMKGSDLIEANNFKLVKSPYSDEEYVAIKAIKPTVAFLHVQEADILGNGRIIGPKYEDILIARAAETVVLTCEKIIDGKIFEANPEFADIASPLVDYVIHAPKGAYPGACAEYYEIDSDAMHEFKKLDSKDNILKYLTDNIGAYND